MTDAALAIADAGMPDAWLHRPGSEGAARPAADVDAYFARIDYTGSRTPGVELLNAIVARHAAAIPFENLDPLLGTPIRLDLASLEAKLVAGGRGGYCFEHNLLLAHVLAALGFRVQGLAARVLWNAPPGARPPRGHMLLLVHFGAPYVVDVGFGGLTLTGSLRLQPDVEQATPHEPFRLTRADGGFVMEAQVAGAWRPLYRFDLQPQHLADYEVTSWYLSNHPDSHFRHGLIAARAAPDARYALRGNELAIHHRGGRTERRTLSDPALLRATLERDFRLTLPEGPDLDRALAAAASGSPHSRTH